jgi:hypothetical protein
LLAEVARTLTPGGCAIITTLDKNRLGYIRKTVFQDHVREYTETELYDKLRASGLTVVGMQRFYYPLMTILREVEAQFERSRLIGPFAVFCIGCAAKLVTKLQKEGIAGGIALRVTSA